MHFIFVRKAARTKFTKITCTRNILDLQYYDPLASRGTDKNGRHDENIKNSSNAAFAFQFACSVLPERLAVPNFVRCCILQTVFAH